MRGPFPCVVLISYYPCVVLTIRVARLFFFSIIKLPLSYSSCFKKYLYDSIAQVFELLDCIDVRTLSSHVKIKEFVFLCCLNFCCYLYNLKTNFENAYERMYSGNSGMRTKI